MGTAGYDLLPSAAFSSASMSPDALLSDHRFSPYYSNDLHDSPIFSHDAGSVVDRLPNPQEIVWGNLPPGSAGHVPVTGRSPLLSREAPIPPSVASKPAPAVESNPFTRSVDNAPDLLTSKAGLNSVAYATSCAGRSSQLVSPTTTATSGSPSMPNLDSAQRRRSAPDESDNLSLRPTKLLRTITDPEATAADPKMSNNGKSSRSTGRVPHNLVERRYRDNLNNQIETLRLCVPSLQEASLCVGDFDENGAPTKLPSKAVVISTAAAYIKELEVEKARLLSTTKALQEQVAGLQKWIQHEFHRTHNPPHMHAHSMPR